MAKPLTITITQTWKDYFANPDEGLGTTYERFILHRYFSWLKARYKIRNVLEAPSFGMTGVSGINSIWWASQGTKVTMVDQSSARLEAIQKVWRDAGLAAEFVCQPPTSAVLLFEDKSFDMAWNFAALWHVKDGDTYLKELGRVARKALFICVPNQQNVCWVLRPHNSSEYELNNIQPDWIISTLEARSWQLAKTGFFDVPPWPDIAMKKEDVLKRVGLSRLAKSMQSKNGERLCILDYFNGGSPAMEQQIMKYSFLENWPNFLKKRWAHHRFFLFERR